MELESTFVRRIKEAVLEVEPSAEVYLYGSRVRGDTHDESDWDFLILLDGPVTEQKKHAIRSRIYEVELDAEEVASLIFYRRSEWNGAQWTPFRENVRREAVVL